MGIALQIARESHFQDVGAGPGFGCLGLGRCQDQDPEKDSVGQKQKRPCSKNKLIDHGRRCAYIRSEWNCVLDVRGDFARFENHNSCGC